MNHVWAFRRFLWVLGLICLACGTPVAGLLFSYSARSTPLPSSSGESAARAGNQYLVCFGQVDLIHGVTAVYPLQPGRVIEVPVSEGQTVEEGTPLVRLDDRMARSRVAEAQAALEEAELRLDQARKVPEQQRSRIAQQQDAVQAMHSRLSAARRQFARQQELQKKQLVNANDVAASEDHVHELEAMLHGEEKRLDDLKKQDPADAWRRAEQEVAVLRARREQAGFALDDCILKAPKRGTVLRVLVGPGDVLSAQPKQPAVQFAALGTQVVRVEVEQEFVGRVRAGQPAVVEDETNPSKSWRGKVERVADWVTQRRSVMQEPLEFNDVRTVETLVTLEPAQEPLRIGQHVRVRIGEGNNPRDGQARRREPYPLQDD
jgi:multidrug resistance efflux pump